MTACELKAFHDRTVSITFFDGEVATAHLNCPGEECEDVMMDVIWTNRPARYPQIDCCSYIVPASEIVSIVEIALVPAQTRQTELPRESLHLVEALPQQQDAAEEPLAA